MSRAALGALALALALAWFGTLGLRPLNKSDESRYAEIAREMVASGDWLTPRLNGFKYFEKPPLQYWATAAAFEVFGERDWAARLWAALTGFGAVLLAFFAGRRAFGERAGLFAAAVLASSPIHVLLGQTNTLDMGLTFFLFLAAAAFVLDRMFVFWAGCALAVLSKGLVGVVLPAGIVFLFALSRLEISPVRKLLKWKGILVFFLISAPWFVAVSLANKEFFHFFFIQEHFERYLTTMHGRYQPWWHFIPVLLVGLLPWLVTVFHGLKNAFDEKSATFLALWAIGIFVFFSASSSKLPSYILPVVPALALLAGRSLSERASSLLFWQSAAFAAVALAGGAYAAAIVRDLAESQPAQMASAYLPWAYAAAACAALGAVAAAWLARRARATAGVLALAAGAFAAAQLLIAGHGAFSPAFSAYGVIQAARAELRGDAPFFAVNAYDHTMPWYLRRTITMVGYQDELAVAIGWEPEKFLPDAAAFARAWSAAPRAAAIFRASEWDDFRRQYPLEMRVLARDARHVIVGKP